MTATPTKITKAPNGSIEVVWADGFTFYFGSLEELKAQVQQQASVSAEQVKWFMLAYGLRRSEDLSNTAAILNKTLTFDLSLAAPWKIQ